MIDKYYGNNEQKFVDGLKRSGICNKIHLEIPGFAKPAIKVVEDGSISIPKDKFLKNNTYPLSAEVVPTSFLVTNKLTSNPLQCNEREPSFHTAGTGNLASKKFANRLDKCVLVYAFL